MSKQPVHFGLIGFGLFGQHHARLIHNTPGAELLGIAVPSQASREEAAEQHPHAQIFEDYRQLLERPEIDIIDIVCPNQLHFPIARDALLAGKHVLLEKPMALTVEHCDQLIELARQQARTLAVGHELRLSSLWGEVRNLIDHHVIGRPLYVLIELSRFPYRQGSAGWRYDRQRVGSWVLEEPIHFFDLARWYLESAGNPTAVFARGNACDPSRGDLYDNFSSIVQFESGAYAVISQTLAAFGHHQTAKVVGTDGAIWASWSAADARSDRCTYSLQYGLGNDVKPVEMQKPAGELLELAEEIAAVSAAVRLGHAPPCTGEDGRWSTRLCLAAEESIRRGVEVPLVG